METKEVKRNLNRRVRYGDSNNYLMSACLIKKNKHGEAYYLAELIDVTAPRSLIYVPLNDISEVSRDD